MTNISGAGALGAPQNFQTGQADQKSRIQFENTMAAANANQAKDKEMPQAAHSANPEMKSFAELLSQGPVQRPVPAQKVMASLTHLIQQNQTGSELDITS